MDDNLINDLTEAVIGAALDVHKTLGPGYLESVYEKALCVELNQRRIPFERQYGFALTYKGTQIGRGRLDFLVDERLIIELKAVDKLIPLHSAQVISYLKALDLNWGLLMNFNTPLLKHGIKRIVLTN
ncbi:MAG: GxxExxY protein [Candidatus Thiodiazotropha sp. (ex Epidulcina cf. delphinae)]|nr:GxxExxY protein [Candidatus Thiodiazotropha sp. (ex Epidulcina cf. delphinae)]